MKMLNVLGIRKSVVNLMLCFVCFGGNSLSRPIAAVQQNVSDVVFRNPGPGFINEVLDLAFPAPPPKPNEQVVFMLRFLPSFHPECEIVIRFSANSGVAIDYLAARVQLIEVLSSGVVDAEKAVEKLDIKRKQTTVKTAVFTNWYAMFWDALAESATSLKKKPMPNQIQLDGTKYLLDMYSSQDHFSLEIVGSEYVEGGHDKDISLIRWMKSIRSEVETLR